MEGDAVLKLLAMDISNQPSTFHTGIQNRPEGIDDNDSVNLSSPVRADEMEGAVCKKMATSNGRNKFEFECFYFLIIIEFAKYVNL